MNSDISLKEESKKQSLDIESRELVFGITPPSPYPPSPRYPKPPKLEANPFEWSSARKAFTTSFCCLLCMFSGYATGSINPAFDQLEQEFGVSELYLLLGTTTYALAFALAPMFLAPFSEIRGRKLVFIASCFLFSISNLGCGLTTSYAGLLIARGFAGLFSSTFQTMVGGVIADIYVDEERNAPMAIFAAASFFGTGIGPIISGVIAFHVSWRWVFYVQAITDAVLGLAAIALLCETRGNILLSQQVNRLNEWAAKCEGLGMAGFSCSEIQQYGVDRSSSLTTLIESSEKTGREVNVRRLRWHVLDEEKRPPLLQSIRIASTRPFHLLFTESIVFWFSLWIAFAWAVFYMALAAIPLTFDEAYNFNLQQSSAIYTAIASAAILGGIIHVVQEKLWRRFGSPPQEPEARLVFAKFECLLFPIGLFWWGWSVKTNVPWIVPTLGLACVHIGTYTILLTVLNYTADSYHRFSSSALAAQSMARNVMGAVFPLATLRLFEALTTPGALSFLGGVAFLLSVIPWVLAYYGPQIRARSKIASEIMNEK